MKTRIVLFFAIVALVFSSCSKDDETDLIWKEANEAAFEKISSSSEYKRIESASRNGSIMYKVIKSGDGRTPLYTDRVSVLYEGWFKRFDWNKDDTYTNENGVKVKNKYVFDSTADRATVPSTFVVAEYIDGFNTALQHMKEGDKWEVWIPARLGYWYDKKGSIPPYTTLVFEIELVKVLSE